METQSKTFKIHNDLHGAGGYMGLNNQMCLDPKYYCKIHHVYLSDEDAANKKCMCKPTFDMIGTTRCKSLITAEEREAELEMYREDLEKINKSRAALGMLAYNVKKIPKEEKTNEL